MEPHSSEGNYRYKEKTMLQAYNDDFLLIYFTCIVRTNCIVNTSWNRVITLCSTRFKLSKNGKKTVKK